MNNPQQISHFCCHYSKIQHHYVTAPQMLSIFLSSLNLADMNSIIQTLSIHSLKTLGKSKTGV